MGRGNWSPGVWRRKVIKRYKRRAMKFQEDASTVEEKMAWLKVSKWFDTILKKSRLNKNGAISLPEDVVQDSIRSEA